ncbi:hypothetical protein [Metapseudomonas otitidis]|uniref:hypothetical protein n=1 Tax=Metapseudomonas otitidis TaxID=319939 RepID=UPI0013F68D56|nr:hypothetical protein [Pseudomonas otitidis]
MSDSDLLRTLRALAGNDVRNGLGPLEPRGALTGKRVSVAYTKPKTGGGGIAGPLIETDGTLRTWWPNGFASTDGLLVLPAIKTLVLKDANGERVEVQLADISAVTP